MKKIIVFMILTVFAVSLQPVYADETVSEIEYLDDGCYYETVIESEAPDDGAQLQATTRTGSKTVYFKNSKGKVQWYVKVKGTFSYGNGSAKCTAASATAVSKVAAWKISDKSSSRSGNAATAKATAKRYENGSLVETKHKSVTLKCSPSGNLS